VIIIWSVLVVDASLFDFCTLNRGAWLIGLYVRVYFWWDRGRGGGLQSLQIELIGRDNSMKQSISQSFWMGEKRMNNNLSCMALMLTATWASQGCMRVQDNLC